MCRGIIAVFAIVCATQAAIVPGRYIVELESEPVTALAARSGGRAALQSPAATAHRTRLRAEHRTMRTRLEQRNARVLESVENVGNAIFVEIADDEATALASLPGVKRIYPVREMRMLLDRAAALHRVPEAWARPGGDRGGEGIKVAIIDTGIEAAHAGFQDPSLKAPQGFPKANTEADLAYTNGKIIVARSYVNLLPARDSDLSARDRVGHGTALGMIVAGVRTAGPLATISGVAPKAYLGNYKVFGSPGLNESTTDDVVIKAIDDAVADGMDVINLSLGSDIAPRLEDDPEVQAIERAVRAGVIVVVAAGNNGGELNTIASPGTAPSAITVGATTNDRTFGMAIDVPGLAPVTAIPGGGATPPVPITAPLADIAALASNSFGCETLTAGSLAGKIAVIPRGSCTFEIKLNNAQRAGAVAAIVYAAADAPNPFTMGVGTATLPAEMVSHQDGLAIRGALAANPSLTVTMNFTRGPVSIAANRPTDFSAAGPNVDIAIKPDLVAVGGDIYTATQTLDPRGDMYSANGFILEDGTSFSAPLVAGAAALLKGARPGLSVEQYRSLLIDSAARLDFPMQRTGAGLLDAAAAIDGPATASPVLLSLGAGGGNAAISRTLTITNVSGAADTFSISSTVTGGSLQPAASLTAVRLEPWNSAQISLDFRASGLGGGSHEGFVTVTSESTGRRIGVPYWYAVTSQPATINVLRSVTAARPAARQRNAVMFRVTDSSGVALGDASPQVTVVSGGGDVAAVRSLDSQVPGLFAVDVILGAAAGNNVFQIRAGGVTREFSIAGR